MVYLFIYSPVLMSPLYTNPLTKGRKEKKQRKEGRKKLTPLQSKDSNFTYLHRRAGREADLFEDFCRDRLPDDEVYVAAQHRPVNPEDEDDVVPDQHAAFGIQRATQRGRRDPAWKDLGLADLMRRGPPASGAVKAARAAAPPGPGAAAAAAAAGTAPTGGFRALPR